MIIILEIIGKHYHGKCGKKHRRRKNKTILHKLRETYLIIPISISTCASFVPQLQYVHIFTVHVRAMGISTESVPSPL